jgi:hypothetical protein
MLQFRHRDILFHLKKKATPVPDGFFVHALPFYTATSTAAFLRFLFKKCILRRRC